MTKSKARIHLIKGRVGGDDRFKGGLGVTKKLGDCIIRGGYN
jgi:hypothetical protein